jgi:hypothetical protein
LHDQFLELCLSDPTVPVGVEGSNQIVDVCEGGFFNVEGHRYSADQLTELVLFEEAGVINVEFFERCCQLFGGY